jgi:hypothetical protein
MIRAFGIALVAILSLSALGYAQEPEPKRTDSYDVLLHSRSLEDQRAALTVILQEPQQYVLRIQETLRNYPQLLRIDRAAANRAVYIAALVRDPSFPPILVKHLGREAVEEGECIYSCPIVFTLTIYASFGDWKPPANLDPNLTTVGDLRAEIKMVSNISLKVGNIRDVVQSDFAEEHRKEMQKQNEEELIRLAGPSNRSYDLRLLAAEWLQTSVTSSKNRVELYLLAINEVRDASEEYRSAVYAAIYRAEKANAQQPPVAFTKPGDDVYVGILDDAREDLRGEKTEAVERRLVMPAFDQRNGEWRPITHFGIRRLKWTVAFDGKNLGEVESQASSDEGDQINSQGSRAKQMIVTLADKVPVVGKPSEEFAGVSSLFGLKNVHRPLVVVSKPYYRDPEGWKRTQPQEQVRRVIREAFRKQFPHVDRCKDEQIAERDWKFPDTALQFSHAYASNKNSFIVAVRLDAGDCGWGGNPEDPTDAFVNQWFLVASDHSVRRIGGFDFLLDAGDYDNAGRSVFIFFSVRSENSDVYDLLYDNFQKKAELEVGYR